MKHPKKHEKLARTLAGLLVGCLLAAPADAHDGPPFVVAVDQSLAGGSLSIWADPDVGVGTFYVYVEEVEDPRTLLPIDLHVTPEDPRWSEATASLKLADEHAPYQLIGEVAFEARGPWTVRFDHPSTEEAIELDVEVTPPGSFGPIDILWFAFPFCGVGFLWVKGVMRQREYELSCRTSGRNA